MKKRSIIGLVLGLVLLNLCFVSAGIYFSELQSKYNFGDIIDLNVNVDPILEGRLLQVELSCQDSEVIQFNELPDEMGEVNIKLPLNYYTINEYNGNCYFLGGYAEESRKSMTFEISKRLVVRLTSDAFFADSGEEILITGVAEKLNGDPVNGEVEITIPLLSLLEIEGTEEVVEDIEEIVEGNETEEIEETDEEVEEEEEEEEEIETQANFDSGKFYGRVENGDFAVAVQLSDEAPAGDYRIDVLAYEEDFGKKSSEGVTMANLKVFQLLKGIDLAVSNQNFNPGEIIDIKPTLVDQTGMNVEEDVSVIISDEEFTRYFEKIVQSRETINYMIPTNISSGYYDISASIGDLDSLKRVFINEKAIVSFEIANSTLVVTNVGNIPYEKDIEIELNGKTFVKRLDLSLSETRKYKLSGPDNQYNIKVSDGESEVVEGGVSLTGRFVDVDTLADSSLSGPLVWIFLIIGLLIILFVIFKNAIKKKSFAFHSNKTKGKVVNLGEKKEVKPEVVEKEKPSSKIPSQADQVLVLKGNRSDAVVLVLKIKNKIGKTEKASLEKAVEHVYNKRGAVYEQGDFIFIIFSPLMTKTSKNEVQAAKVAEKVVKVLIDHNKKFREKIDYGIGINSGEIINKVEDNKLKFTALGNFIIVAKRLAESSNKQILVTKNSYERGISDIKVEKKQVAGGEVYEVKNVIDKEKNQKFIAGFLNRMGKENK
jgi:hypothetical protein